ncbi:GNAT family N-acetyltransferase [Paenibacillus sp. O199]|uniref:GNAT family N-acetyltransferase n=1 Tax=Paenibacillus sp. O199 TaxID=1643925 RepID=UPI0007BF02EF|nr:GNAT family N-acetyltransferase [Paenibacillus sp. O199]
MISELNKHEFYKVRHFADLNSNIEVKAVVTGLNPGRIYVDDASNITAALIWVKGQNGFQLIGDARSESFLNELEEFMKEHIEPELLRLNIHTVEVGVADESWEDVLHHMAANKELYSDIQHVFTLDSDQGMTEHLRHPGSHEGYASQNEVVRLLELDEALLKAGKFNNLSFLKDKVSRFWDNMDEFLEHGFGYIAVQGEDIASVCFSAFISDQWHAIDIETIEAYKRRNYGARVARAFVEECRIKGIHPYWDCSPDNAGSIRLAEGVGMSLNFDYRVYWYNLS